MSGDKKDTSRLISQSDDPLSLVRQLAEVDPEVDEAFKDLKPQAPSGVSVVEPGAYPGPVVIAGSGAGIGLELAKRLLGDGARVALSYHSDPTQATLLELANGERVAACLPLDITLEAAVDRFFQDLAETTPRLYAGIYCIGPLTYDPLDDLSDDAFEAMLQANLVGAFRFARRIKPFFKKQGAGRLVVFTHAGADRLKAYGPLAGYAAAKAGLLSLVRSLALAWSNEAITVNAIGPGLVETSARRFGGVIQKSPAPRTTRVDDLYRALLAILDPGAEHITGAQIDVSGGFGL